MKNIPTFVYEHRTNPQVMNALIAKFKNPGLRYHALDSLLEKEQYETLLPLVWAERDRAFRLNWLRDNAKWHVPLMLEWAMAEMKHCIGQECDKARVFKTKVEPLLAVAMRRILQDVRANKHDPSLSSVPGFMQMVYMQALAEMRSKAHLEKAFEDACGAYAQEGHKEQQALLKSLEKDTESGLLPSSQWMEGHGMGAYFSILGAKEVPQASDKDKQAFRLEVVREAIVELQPLVNSGTGTQNFFEEGRDFYEKSHRI